MLRTPIASALAASLLLASSVVAQSSDTLQLSGPPTYAGTYDMSTATLVPPGAGDSGTQTTLYNNTTDNGSFFQPGVGKYNMDWGTFAVGGSGATVTAIQIAYATTKITPVSLTIRLHQGATGFGVKGTEILNLPLTGLPPSTVSGQAQGFVVDVTLASPLTILDGGLGYSYQSLETATGPLLVGPPNEAGVVNDFDQYNATTNAYLGTFAFTGATPPFASFHLKVTGRSNNPPPDPWANYGVANGMTLTGTGPGTVGSNDTITMDGIQNKKAVFVAGLVQSDIIGGANHIEFYASPWLVFIPDLVLPPPTGTLDLPVTLPVGLTPGTKIYMQVIGQALNNTYTKWSDGLELTIQ